MVLDSTEDFSIDVQIRSPTKNIDNDMIFLIKSKISSFFALRLNSMLFLKIKASKNSQLTTARLQGKKLIQFKEGLNQGPLDLKSVAAVVVQWVRAFATQAEGWVFESQP